MKYLITNNSITLLNNLKTFFKLNIKFISVIYFLILPNYSFAQDHTVHSDHSNQVDKRRPPRVTPRKTSDSPQTPPQVGAPTPPSTPPPAPGKKRPPAVPGGGSGRTCVAPETTPVNLNSCQQKNYCGCEGFAKIPRASKPRLRIEPKDLVEFPNSSPGLDAYKKLGYCTGVEEPIISTSLKNGVAAETRVGTKRKYTLKLRKEKDPITKLEFLKTTMEEYDSYDKLKNCNPLSQSDSDIKSKSRAVNAPPLFFNEGEIAVIKVINEKNPELESTGTSIHWHGLILPNNQDGIIGITQAPIEPGKVKEYEFLIQQNGTYWYHPHDLYEQDTKGAFIIFSNPEKERNDNYRRANSKIGNPTYGGIGVPYHHDRTLFFSDYKHDKNSKEVLGALMFGENLNQYQFDSQIGREFLNQLQCTEEYLNNFSFMKMFFMDPADVWYTSFFINDEICLNCGGVLKKLSNLPKTLDLEKQKVSKEFNEFKKGEKVRLRLINGSASSYFYLDYANDSKLNPNQKLDLLVVAKDGLSVAPIYTDQLYMGMGETYDVVVDIPENGNLYEFRIKSIDDLDNVLDKNDPNEKGRRISRVLLGNRMGIKDNSETSNLDQKDNSESSFNPQSVFSAIGSAFENIFETTDDDFNKKLSRLSDSDINVVSGRNVPIQFCGPYPKESDSIQEINYSLLKMLNSQDTTYPYEVYHFEAEIENHYLSIGGNMDDYYWTINGTSKEKLADEKEKAKGEGSLLKDVLLSIVEGFKSFHNFVIKGENGSGTILKSRMGMPYLEISEGKRIRVTINNDMVMGMMNHPWHLHGNWFRLVEDGDTDEIISKKALLHTATIFPGETKTLEFYSDPEYRGAWMFHCHNLYHMANDMMMFLKYKSLPDSEIDNMTMGASHHHHQSGFLEDLKLKNQGIIAGVSAYAGTDGQGVGASLTYRGTLGRGWGYVVSETELTTDQLEIINEKKFSLESKFKYCFDFQMNKCVFLKFDFNNKGDEEIDHTTYAGYSFKPFNSDVLVVQTGIGPTCEHSEHSAKTNCNIALMNELSASTGLIRTTKVITKVSGRIGCEGKFCKDFYSALRLDFHLDPQVVIMTEAKGSTDPEETYVKAQITFTTQPIQFGTSH